MKDWLRKFMYGRYGVDTLNRDLIFLNLGIYIIILLLPRKLNFLMIIGYIPLGICIFRTLSKDIFKRQQENYKYLALRNKYMPIINKKINRIKSSKDYKYLKCPNCKQELRVPRKQGKITVTCPKCRNSFKAKS